MSYFIKPLLFILLITGVFGLVWLRSSIVAVEYQIGIIEKERTDALREKKTLIASKASALSMQEVELRGVKLSGLSFPDRKNVFYVKGGDWNTYTASLRGESTFEQKGGNP